MSLIEQAEDFVSNLLKNKLSEAYHYHNLNHTLEVVGAVKILVNAEKINHDDSEIVLLAAWFHDSGYIVGYENHEILSTSIASDFLRSKNKSEEYIGKVSSIIMATTYGHIPETILEKIIKDADYYHFTSKDYFNKCELLREEWATVNRKKYTDLEWSVENLKMLTEYHKYYTDYAVTNWKPIKEQNIKSIQDKIVKEISEKEKLTTGSIGEKVEKKKNKRPGRGVETLFRITLSNHIRLSSIADSKANILLSVNAIIISISLSTIIPKLDNPKNAHLIIPTFIMLIFSVATIIFAILSTKPKVTKGNFTKEDIEEKKVNLLFFGNFYQMPLDEYETALHEIMEDRKYLYNSLIMDLYYLGIVLEKKYRLLSTTYKIFMVGIIVSVIAFMIAFHSVNRG